MKKHFLFLHVIFEDIKFQDLRALLELAEQYIEIWHNQKRRHSALKYRTINEFNNQSK